MWAARYRANHAAHLKQVVAAIAERGVAGRLERADLPPGASSLIYGLVISGQDRGHGHREVAHCCGL
jgi:hypothetical protein